MAMPLNIHILGAQVKFAVLWRTVIHRRKSCLFMAVCVLHYAGSCLEGLSKALNNLSQDSRFPAEIHTKDLQIMFQALLLY
jgi:hypothetical protein